MLELFLTIQIQISRVCIPNHPCDVYSEVDCEKDPRSCFPDDLVGTGAKEDDRGSGRISKSK
jgi:hypothetical protein